MRNGIERWRQIGNTRYDVSDLGNVRSWARSRPVNLTLRRPGRDVVVTMGWRVGRVYELVLEAFIGTCPAGHYVHFNNKDRRDCRLTNISWKMPDHEYLPGPETRRALSVRHGKEVIRRVRAGETQISVANDLGLSKYQVHRIVQRFKGYPTP